MWLPFPTEQPLTWRFEIEVECVSTNSGRMGAWSNAAICRDHSGFNFFLAIVLHESMSSQRVAFRTCMVRQVICLPARVSFSLRQCSWRHCILSQLNDCVLTQFITVLYFHDFLFVPICNRIKISIYSEYLQIILGCYGMYIL